MLSFHANYACRHSAACCTAPWDVSVDARRARRADEAVALGTLDVPGAPDRRRWRAALTSEPGRDDEVLVGRATSGGCVFLDRDAERLCALERACGHDALPGACQQFPRVTLADDRGRHVTLSHYCPTVAALTVSEPGARVAIVAAPAGFCRAPLEAGLDARGHWPPLLRPAVLCSIDAWSAWESWVVNRLGHDSDDPFASLHAVAAACEHLRAWSPDDGDMVRFVERTLMSRASDRSSVPSWRAVLDPVAEWRHAWSAVPPDLSSPPRLFDTSPAWLDAVERAVDALRANGRAVSRYLASRAFASWSAYQGHGLRSHANSLRMSLAVLVVEMAREMAGAVAGDHGATATRPVQARLIAAMRRADWLLVHLADSARLAAHWAAGE